jgi:ribokinase
VDLVCIGASSLDLYLHVPHLPNGDDKMIAQFGGRRAGGLVANTACAAARLGLRSAWSGLLGGDDYGRLLLDELHRFGVDTAQVEILPGQTSDFCVILLEPGGERTIVVVNTLPSPPPIPPALETTLFQAKFVYTIPLELDWLRHLARLAHAGEGKLALDIESSSPLSGAALLAALQVADLVFCSQGGLALAAGENELQGGAQFILTHGPQLVVVTQGARGATAFTAGGEVTFSPGFSVPVVDTTGAGDCFHAAFMASSLKGDSLAECLRFANAAAALSTQQLGARGGLPTRAEVEAFLAPIETNLHRS